MHGQVPAVVRSKGGVFLEAGKDGGVVIAVDKHGLILLIDHTSEGANV
jgi:hypothetical protein